MSETPQHGSHAQGDDKLQRQASQLAYDVKYKVKQKLGKDSKLSPAQVTKAYMQQLAASPAPAGVKALAKKKLVGEEHTSFMQNSAKDLVLETLTKVFIEGIEEKVEEEVVSEADEKKYKVRVTDKASGNTYVTNATRAKIAELRANKNISSVEMTGYGTPIQTKADGGKKAKKDYDGDGKVESGSKEHAGAVHNAIQRKKGGVPDGKDTRKESVEIGEAFPRVKGTLNPWEDPKTGKSKVKLVKDPKTGKAKEIAKEEIIYETEEKDGEKKITGKGVNNAKLIKIMPNLGEEVGVEDPKQKQLNQQKLSNLKRLQMKKQQLERQKLNLQKQGKLPMGEETCSNCGGKGCEKCEKKDGDERAKPTEMSLIKNKMRARGIQVAGLDIAPRNMKTADELGEAANRAEYEKVAKAPAPKDDKKLAYSFKDNKDRQRDLKKLARLVRHADGQKRNPAMYNSFEPQGEVVTEEDADRLRDQRMERGGVDGNRRYDRPPAKKLSNKEMGIRDFTPAEKAKRAKEMAAHLKKMK